MLIVQNPNSYKHMYYDDVKWRLIDDPVYNISRK